MKYVGAAEFKANCLRLMAEMQADGEPITVTKRGKPLAVVSTANDAGQDKREKRKALFDSLRGTITVHGDIVGPIDLDWETEWERNNPSDLYRSDPERA